LSVGDDWENLSNELSDNSPDLVLVDIGSSESATHPATGAELIANVDVLAPQTGCIALYEYEPDASVFTSLEAGASACMEKSTDVDSLVGIIRSVFAGEQPILDLLAKKPNVATRLSQALSSTVQAGRPVNRVLTSLTGRELNVLNQLAEGVAPDEIHQRIADPHAELRPILTSIVAKLRENRSIVSISPVLAA
jgi:DNA-binding NarL/FixJ family response regulator